MHDGCGMHMTDAGRYKECTAERLSERVQNLHQATHTPVILSITSVERIWREESMERTKQGNTLTAQQKLCSNTMHSVYACHGKPFQRVIYGDLLSLPNSCSFLFK